MKVIEINEATKAGLIEIMQEALNEAKEGKLASICIAKAYKSGNIGGSYYTERDKYQLYAAIKLVETAYFDRKIS